MKAKIIASIVVIIIGIILLAFANNIAQQVTAGKERIATGQSQIDTTNTIMSSNNYTKPYSSLVTGSGQEKVNAGNVEVSHYESVAQKLQLGGIVLIIIGFIMGVFFLFRKK